MLRFVCFIYLLQRAAALHFHFKNLQLLLFFKMSLRDTMQRHCQQAIQGIFKTRPFNIVVFSSSFYFFDVGPIRKLFLFRLYLMQGN